jgi:hypothetical protein
MSEGERYLFNLYTGAPYFNTFLQSNNCKAQFNMTFASLPTKYSKFRVQCNFRSQAFTGLLTDVGFINISFARSMVYDGSMTYNNVAMIYPTINNNTTGSQSSYYLCTSNDNCDFIIDYPQSGIFTVTLKNFTTGNDMANMPNWNLQLALIGINDDTFGHNNILQTKDKPTFN